ncbi:MAG TPA: hypothetical protein DCS21_06600 [Gammaproteobacteria bacterium]|nr:hypothetical protein [Gammaproteobacteria bacterium]
MSYILDALRQAEHDRQHRERPLLPMAPPEPSLRRWWIGGALLGLLLNAALLVIILLPSRPTTTPEPAPAPIVQPPVTNALTPKPTPDEVRKPSTPKPAPTRRSPAKKPVAPMARPVAPSSPSRLPDPEPVSKPPLLDVLPVNARRNIPALKLDVHIHSDQARQRFVIINGRRYREGEQIEEGPVLETITPDGATLRQGRQWFRLPVR